MTLNYTPYSTPSAYAASSPHPLEYLGFIVFVKNGATPGWPPPQPNLTLQMIAAIRPDPFIISEAAKGTYIKERDRRVLEDNRRQIAEAEQRQREFEKQKAAETEAAKARDRQAYRERGWLGG
jgi:hypothetical protein